ncbi:MAG: VWA domain-containing protein [Crenarchaeota archaeon]|nr:VWA domain-containing protein [Thermoproteota archaeon]
MRNTDSEARKLLEDFENIREATIIAFPYLSPILRRVKPVFISAPGFTAGVTEQKDKVYIGVEWWRKLTAGEKMFTLLHEILHLALQHGIRSMRLSSPELYNIAADAVINEFIIAAVKSARTRGVAYASKISAPFSIITHQVLVEKFGLQIPYEEFIKRSADEIYYMLLRNIPRKQFSLPKDVIPDVSQPIPNNARVVADGSSRTSSDMDKKGSKKGGKQDEKKEGKGSEEGKGVGEALRRGFKGLGRIFKPSRKREEKEKEGTGETSLGEEGKKEGDEEKILVVKRGGKEVKVCERSEKGEEIMIDESEAENTILEIEEDLSTLFESIRCFESLYKTAGTETAHFQALIETLNKSKINWKTILRASLDIASKGQVVSTWRRPSRRVDCYPGYIRFNERSLEVYCLVDVSGSVVREPNLLRDFFSEVVEIARIRRGTVWLIPWDTEVKGVYKISSVPEAMDAVRQAAKDVGGGTIIDPALNYVLENLRKTPNAKRNTAVVLLSDGCWACRDQSLFDEIVARVKRAVFIYTISPHPELNGWIRIQYQP